MVNRLKPTVILSILALLATLSASNIVIAQEIGNYDPKKPGTAIPISMESGKQLEPLIGIFRTMKRVRGCQRWAL